MCTKCTTALTVVPASLVWNSFQSIKNSFNKNHYTNVFVIVNFNDDAADQSIIMTCKQVHSSYNIFWILPVFRNKTFAMNFNNIILITNLRKKWSALLHFVIQYKWNLLPATNIGLKWYIMEMSKHASARERKKKTWNVGYFKSTVIKPIKVGL